jgi:hypothetical protein
MPCNIRRILNLLLGIVILTFILAGFPPGASAAPPGQKYREDGVLGLAPVSLPSYRQVCTGSTIPLTFQVKNVSPGLEIPLPVVEAMVTVTDDQGVIRAHVTNGAGSVSFYWPATKEGTLTFTVEAAKEYYLPASPLKIQIEVTPCRWALKVSFHEEYSVVSDFGLVVGATTQWSGGLTSKMGTGENPVREIELAGGSGQFQFYTSDQIAAPFHFSLDPQVSGEYSLKGKGTSDGREIRLNIGTDPVEYPKVITWKITDYSNQGITIKYQPPVTTSDGNGLFLELNKLNDLTFPVSGGIVNLDSGMSCYFFTPDRTKYNLSIMLYALSSDVY